jgi:hypothetical protein
MRDGVNLSRMQVTRPLVMHTEVTNLPNLVGYLRFGRSLPVVRFIDSYNKLPSIAVAFAERIAPPVRLSPQLDGEGALTKAAPKRGARPTRRKSSSSSHATAEIPPEQEEAGFGGVDAPAPNAVMPRNDGESQAPPVPPPLELFGKPAGFRLSQHARHDGARNRATPA